MRVRAAPNVTAGPAPSQARPWGRIVPAAGIALLMVIAALAVVASVGGSATAIRAAPAPASAPAHGDLHGPAGAPVASSTIAPGVGAPAVSPNGHVIFNAPGPHPSSWGAHGVPPGWQALAGGASAPSASGWGGGSGSSSASNWDNRFCAGLWPNFPTPSGNPQGVYASGCYGHDEPNIQFYSDLPGSGGNVTWNVTLPVDRSATLNQSNLYSAIWFGMTLTDPYAWMDQCFLELQFYPDQTFYNPGPMFPNWTVNGAWIGAAVAWQIQASTGFENPCFYEPLYLNGHPGPAFLNMTQGDRISVTMTGWTTNTAGELLQIHDLSNGQRSAVRLFNSTGNYPLNPSYRTNTFENGLEWTPGGEFPVVFAFETGHAGNPDWPANNSYGGCSPGIQSTPSDPGAPCPSYDPGSWANDSLAPWHIDVPTFFDARGSVGASQVGLGQDFGGIDLISSFANGACNGNFGGQWCSYPWYSYSCASHSFAFGATDYANTTSDFGKYTQYATNLVGNALGFGFFAPTNFSIPSCGGATATVTVGTAGPAGGAAYFLSHPYTALTAIAGVTDGKYSVNAINGGGAKFDHWSTSGGVAVAIATSAWTSVDVTGPGHLVAVFSASPRTTTVTFRDVPAGSVGLDPAMTFSGPFSGNGNPLGTIASGGTFTLSPGIYSIQAYPTRGYNFSSWSSSSGAATIAAPSFPYTWLIVTGTASSVDVTAHFAKTSVMAKIELAVFGNGTASFGTQNVTNAGGPYAVGFFKVLTGTYALVGTPGVGANNVAWLYGPNGVMTNFSQSTLINVEQGFTLIEAIFGEVGTVTLSDAPATGGATAWLTPTGWSSPLASGTTVSEAAGTYWISAVPFSGEYFTGWTTTGGATVGSASAIVTTVDVTGGSATVTAHYAHVAATVSVRYGVPAPGEGRVQLDDMSTAAKLVTNGSVAPGEHTVSALANPGWVFAGWHASTNIVLVGGPQAAAQTIDVVGPGTISAVFAPTTEWVTFVAYEPEGASASTVTLTIGGTTLATGTSVLLATGTYHATLAGQDDHVQLWTSNANLTLVPGTPPTSVTVSVHGSGTVYVVFVDSDHDAGTSTNVAGGHGATTGGVPVGHAAAGAAVARAPAREGVALRSA
jgi:hypothetical protein